jgi:hypothetical protein
MGEGEINISELSYSRITGIRARCEDVYPGNFSEL